MKSRTVALTGLTLVAFASNSVLCRLALGGAAIDAASFTILRLLSGAVMLLAIARLAGRKRPPPRRRGSWISAVILFVYAVAFSFAYLSLSAGTGALILFGAVQATMVLAALRAGERPRAREWGGLAAALAGVAILVFPGLAAPSPFGSALMALSGIAWGVYSLRGRGAVDPLSETTWNFVRSLPLVALVGLVSLPRMHLSATGVRLAVASGALASGLGYTIWYAALRGLSATRAATVQLAVPLLAALGGVIFLSETVSPRLVIAAVLILGGVGAAAIKS